MCIATCIINGYLILMPGILRRGISQLKFVIISGKSNNTPDVNNWPPRPLEFPDLMTPIEAAMYLRLDQTGHNPKSAIRTNLLAGQRLSKSH